MSNERYSVFTNFVAGKGRPRFTRSGIVYTPQQTREHEEEIKALWLDSGHPVLSGPVAVTILVQHPLPISTPKRTESRPYTVKPDVDNVAKLVLDALNGIAFDDDKQVVDLTVTKLEQHRGVKPCMKISVQRV